MNTQRLQVLGLLGILGILGSLGWASLNTVFSPDWGPPGTSRYLGYETINRLWAPAFALILCGYVGLYGRYALRQARSGRVGFRLVVGGLLLMMAGNIAEFWFLTEQGYGELNARSFAWMSVLLGWLVVGIGQILIGLAGLRQGSLPRWAAWLFMLALPVWLMFLFSFVEWMGLAFIVTGLLAGALAAWPSAGPTVHSEAA
jgi:hypothetical protein